MAFEGMDVDGAQAVVGQINNSKDEFSAVLSRLTTAVNQIQWTGPDQTQYVQEWQSHSQQLTASINQFIEAMAQKLSFEISQQTQASAN